MQSRDITCTFIAGIVHTHVVIVYCFVNKGSVDLWFCK